MFIWGYNLVNCKIKRLTCKMFYAKIKCKTFYTFSLSPQIIMHNIAPLTFSVLLSHTLHGSSLLLHLSTLSLTKPQPSHLPSPSCTTHLPRPSHIDDRCHLPTPNTIINACTDVHPLTNATY